MVRVAVYPPANTAACTPALVLLTHALFAEPQPSGPCTAHPHLPQRRQPRPQVKNNILPVTVADAAPASPPAVEATQRGETLSQRATAADCLLLRWAQAAHALHCAGLAGQALAAELHRLWAYEEKASQHVKLPPSARDVRPRTPCFGFSHA